MEQRFLGRTGLKVSVLRLGGHTYPIGWEGSPLHRNSRLGDPGRLTPHPWLLGCSGFRQ
jgi:hypothetical protein